MNDSYGMEAHQTWFTRWMVMYFQREEEEIIRISSHLPIDA